MTRTEKEQFVSDLRESFEKAQAMVTVAFSGLNVAAATELRRRFREGGVEYRVVKNTLAKRAAEGTNAAELTEHFEGPTAVVLGYEDDVVTPAKILYGFLKENAGKLEVKGGVVDGKLYSSGDVEALSKLPGLQELRGQLLALINTPAQTLVRLASTPATQLTQVLKAKSDQSQED